MELLLKVQIWLRVILSHVLGQNKTPLLSGAGKVSLLSKFDPGGVGFGDCKPHDQPENRKDTWHDHGLKGNGGEKVDDQPGNNSQTCYSHKYFLCHLSLLE